MRENLSLMDIMNIVLKWWWIIALMAIICAGGMYVHSEYFQDEIFESKGSLYVNAYTNETESISLSMQESNARLGETYIELANSESVLAQVSSALENEGYGYVSINRLKSMISYSVLNETEVIEIKTLDENPALAQAVTNTALSVIPAEIQKIVQVGRIEVVDKGKLPTSPAYPDVLRQTLIGLLIGLIIGCGLVVLLEFLDLRIKPENNLEQMYDIPVLGNIPEIKR